MLGFIHNNMFEKIKSNLSPVRYELYLLKGTVEWQDSGVLRLSIGPLKGQCHEIFDFRFFLTPVANGKNIQTEKF